MYYDIYASYIGKCQNQFQNSTSSNGDDLLIINHR